MTIGDIVIVQGPHEFPRNTLTNKIGVVRSVEKCSIGIEFFHEFVGGHNLNGRIDNMHGWFVNESSLIKLEPVKNVIQKVFFE